MFFFLKQYCIVVRLFMTNVYHLVNGCHATVYSVWWNTGEPYLIQSRHFIVKCVKLISDIQFRFHFLHTGWTMQGFFHFSFDTIYLYLYATNAINTPLRFQLKLLYIDIRNSFNCCSYVECRYKLKFQYQCPNGGS